MNRNKQFQKMHFSKPTTQDQVAPSDRAPETANTDHIAPVAAAPLLQTSPTLLSGLGISTSGNSPAIGRKNATRPFNMQDHGQFWTPASLAASTTEGGAPLASGLPSPIHGGETLSLHDAPQLTDEVEETSALDTHLIPSVRRKRNLRAIALIGLVILLVAAASLWIGRKGSTDVTLYSVGVQNVSQYVGGGGIVYPAQQLTVSYSVTERVVNVLVKPGQHVTVNQPLVQLDPQVLNAQLQKAQSDVDAAQAYLNTVLALGNRLTIAQAQQSYNQAKSRYDALAAQMASPLLHNGNLVSPMNGIVTGLNVNPGDVFPAGKSLLTVMDESTMIVKVNVPLANLTQVHMGETATVTPSSTPNLTLKGTVSVIVPLADAQTDTFEVWISVPNTQDALLPGMSAFVRIQQSMKAIIVPRLAVLNPDREGIVFVVRNGRAYIQPVHVIARSSTTLFVDSGLKSGDQVVLVGLSSLQDGQPVSVTRVES